MRLGVALLLATWLVTAGVARAQEGEKPAPSPTSLLNELHQHHPYAWGHSMRVAVYARGIARALGLSEEQVKQVTAQALVHDVGKIEVPTDLLDGSRPELTPEEWAVIKHHPQVGVQKLRGTRMIGPWRHLAAGIEGVETHHERMDGKGYPRNLPAAEIPLAGMIIGVADTWDATTTNRTYQKAFSLADADRIVKTKVAEGAFDGKVVRALMRSLREDPKSRHTLLRARTYPVRERRLPRLTASGGAATLH